eukprot:12116862-Karenia_brevis.AAC.1
MYLCRTGTQAWRYRRHGAARDPQRRGQEHSFRRVPSPHVRRIFPDSLGLRAEDESASLEFMKDSQAFLQAACRRCVQGVWNLLLDGMC